MYVYLMRMILSRHVLARILVSKAGNVLSHLHLSINNVPALLSQGA